MTENNTNIEKDIKVKPTRRYDIDALRVYAIILLIIFHTAMLFAYGTPFFFQNAELSVEMLILVFVLNTFLMPLFFLFAGMSTSYALDFRTGREYLKERVRRLVIPLIFGIFIVIPPIVYYERRASWSPTRYTTKTFNGTFFEFYPLYFEIGTINWYTLWFLAYLFIFSLVALRLFLRWKKDEGKQQISSIAEKYGKGKKIFLFALPLIIINVSLRWIFPGIGKEFINDLANVFSYFMIFLYGFLIVSDGRFEDSVDRNKKLALILAIISSPLVIIFLGPGYDPFGNPVGYAIYWTLFSFNGWCWLIAIFGYGRKNLTKRNSLINYLSKIILPIYILHMTVIVIIAFYVLQWEAYWVIKFLIIATLSLVITILLSILIKTNNVTRFIFGMRPKVKKTEVK